MEIMITVLELIACHFIGDYILQTRFIAESKGENFYHLFIHCFTYCIPFYVLFGLNWQLIVVFVVHFITDPLKARWHKINYLTDQIIHFVVMSVYFIQ